MPYDDRDDEVDAEIDKLQGTVVVPKCPQCGSEKIIPNALLWGGSGENLKVIVLADPDAILFKGYESEELNARVCGNCGLTQFFAKLPARLYAVYQTSLKSQIKKPD